MLLNDSKKGPPHVHYRRPYGCAVLAMSDVLHTISELKEEKDFVLKVYTWVSSTCTRVFKMHDLLVIDVFLCRVEIHIRVSQRSSVSSVVPSVMFLRQEFTGTKQKVWSCEFLFSFLTNLYPCLLLNSCNKNAKYSPLSTTSLSKSKRISSIQLAQLCYVIHLWKACLLIHVSLWAIIDCTVQKS